MSAPFVLVYGATGRTGREIIQGILRVGGLRVGAITRSETSPTAQEYKNQGIELRILDVSKDIEAELVEKLKGVDVIVSVVGIEALESQRILFKAAKTAGVGRVVPSDFATPAPEGVMTLHDQKLAIHKYIEGLGLAYTYIDIAWWKQLTLPYPPSQKGAYFTPFSYQFFANGKQAFAVTDMRIIGDFVGRIVKDPRTLNKYVFVHEDITTQDQAWKLAEELSPEGAEIISKKVVVSSEDLAQRIISARAAFEEDPKDILKLYARTSSEYALSKYVRGDNTLAKAKELGALDARELYPEVQVQSLREFAQQFYNDPANAIYI